MIAWLLVSICSALSSEANELVKTEAPRSFSSVYIWLRVILDVVWSHPLLTVCFLCLVGWVTTKAVIYLRDRSGDVEVLMKPNKKGRLLG